MNGEPSRTDPQAAAPRGRPTFEYEAAELLRLGPDALVCGVDEAGRGPLAGPVVAAAAALPPGPFADRAAVERVFRDAGVDDSKKLSEAKRETAATALRALAARGALIIGVGAASVREIDALNIARANELAMIRALRRLCRAAGRDAPDFALIDGNRVPAAAPCPAAALVKGDARALTVAAASILAKTTRDRIMRRLAARRPGYLWERNAGYPTADHRAALDRLGPTPHHRRSFRAAPPRRAAS